MKTLKQILEAASIHEENYYYHGTSRANADTIDKHGITNKNSKYNSITYLTKTHREASKYAKISDGKSHGVVYTIHKDDLEPDHIASENSGIIQHKGNIPRHKLKRI